MQRYKKKEGGGLKIALGLATLLSGIAYATSVNDGSIFNKDVVIGSDMTIGTKGSRWNVWNGNNKETTKASKNITILNGATLTIDATNGADFGYMFAAISSKDTKENKITWTGGNIVLDFQSAGYGGVDGGRGGIYAADSGKVFTINSNFNFTYREYDNSTSSNGHDGYFRGSAVAAISSFEQGKVFLDGDIIKITTDGKKNQNYGLGIFALSSYRNGTIYLNAKENGSVNKNSAVVQIIGSIATGMNKANSNQPSGSGKLYAHFTGDASFLKGNIYSGLYGGNSNLEVSFTGGATMDGDIVFLGDSRGERSEIIFNNSSKFKGNINTLASGTHTVTFDGSAFEGVVKHDRSKNAIQNTALTDSGGNPINIALGHYGDGNNVVLYLNNNSTWMMTGDSTIANLEVNNSVINLKDSDRGNSNGARKLTITNLKADNGMVVLGTEIIGNNAGQGTRGAVVHLDNTTYSNDQVVVENFKSGTLQVSAQAKTTEHKSFDTASAPVVLVTATNVTTGAQVTGSSRQEGISTVSTQIVHQVSSDGKNGWFDANEGISLNGLQHRWVLASYDVSANQDLVDEGGIVLSNPYRMLLIETNNLNKRMGDLRGNNYQQGAWVRLFNGMDSGEGAKNLYTNIQLGYDYAFGVKEAKNYTGVAFSTSIVDTDGNYFDGKSNTYSFAVYNSYIADSGLYVDTIAKYLYTDQKLTANGGVENNFGNHALSLGAEFGYQVYVADTKYYLEPQAELVSGLILGVKDINVGKFGGRAVMGELETVTAFNARIGLVQGYTLETEKGIKADFRVGMSYVGEYVSNATPIKLYDGLQNTHSEIGNDNKFLLSLGTTVAITDEWRTYFDAEKSFGGKRNTDYQINFGARFSFGEIVKPIPDLNKQQKPFTAPLKTEEQAQPVQQLPQQPAQPVSKQVKAQKAK